MSAKNACHRGTQITNMFANLWIAFELVRTLNAVVLNMGNQDLFIGS